MAKFCGSNRLGLGMCGAGTAVRLKESGGTAQRQAPEINAQPASPTPGACSASPARRCPDAQLTPPFCLLSCLLGPRLPKPLLCEGSSDTGLGGNSDLCHSLCWPCLSCSLAWSCGRKRTREESRCRLLCAQRRTRSHQPASSESQVSGARAKWALLRLPSSPLVTQVLNLACGTEPPQCSRRSVGHRPRQRCAQLTRDLCLHSPGVWRLWVAASRCE